MSMGTVTSVIAGVEIMCFEIFLQDGAMSYLKSIMEKFRIFSSESASSNWPTTNRNSQRVGRTSCQCGGLGCSPAEAACRRKICWIAAGVKAIDALERVHDLTKWAENIVMRKKCASDITPEKFGAIHPLLQSMRRRTNPTTVDLYDVFCAVL